ncbi:DUF711 family protein [Nocardia sp. NPDC020380]|uniref:DUF711 family protein n=1 Tax=Nocardia sp. NPDC020380 TaxID=3364309 RepID=UPI00378BF576
MIPAKKAAPVRAVTVGLPDAVLRGGPNGIRELGEQAREVGDELVRDGFDVQTIRLSASALGDPLRHDQLLSRAADLAEGCRRAGVGSASLGVFRPAALTGLEPADLAAVLAEYPSLFLAVQVAAGSEICDPAVGFSAAVVRELANHNVHDNFRFAAIGNLGPGAPLFPGSFSDGGPAGVSAGLQSAGLLLEWARANPPADPAEVTVLTQRCLRDQLALLEDSLRPACERHGLLFNGFDPSPACTPEAGIGEFLEAVGGIRFGVRGMLATCAAVTAGIRSAARRTVGYAGLMLPVLEDKVLALAWQEGRIDADSVLAYSSVCGAGLDTIPLPGATSEAEIVAMIRDMAALSARWAKPLSARLMLAAPGSDPRRTQFCADEIVNIDYPGT